MSIYWISALPNSLFSDSYTCFNNQSIITIIMHYCVLYGNINHYHHLTLPWQSPRLQVLPDCCHSTRTHSSSLSWSWSCSSSSLGNRTPLPKSTESLGDNYSLLYIYWSCIICIDIHKYVVQLHILMSGHHRSNIVSGHINLA